MNNSLKIGAAYIRVSDSRQDEYSPDSQLKMIRSYATKEGYLVPDEYIYYDDGISGRDVKKRHSFNDMIAMAKDKSHPFDTIFVWKFSRFARNQEQAVVFKNLLKKSGVSVISVSEPIPDGYFGSLIERIIEWTDEYYSARLSQEVERGIEEKISRGEPICNAPFGYIMKDKQWIPHETNADIVREVFQRYADGEKIRQIAIYLDGQGVKTRHGNTPDNRFVSYMLNNPSYVGKLRKSPAGTRAVSKRFYDDEGIKIVNGHHEPIITEELWEAVQNRLKEQKQKYPKFARKEPAEYLLKGLVRCDSCGATLTLQTLPKSNDKAALQCHNYNRGQCKVSHHISMPNVEKAVIDGLESAIKERQFVIVPPKKKAPPSQDVDYDKLIALEERKLERVREAYISEIDTLEQYRERKALCERKIAELKAKRDEVAISTKVEPIAFAEKVAKVLEFIKKEDVSVAAKNDALRTIIESIVYEKANNNLAIYFHNF